MLKILDIPNESLITVFINLYLVLAIEQFHERLSGKVQFSLGSILPSSQLDCSYISLYGRYAIAFVKNEL